MKNCYLILICCLLANISFSQQVDTLKKAPDSTWTYYTHDGKVKEQMVYKNGVLIKPETYKGQMTPPVFPGGEAALRKFLSENVKYPPEDKKYGISATINVSFIVDKEGKIKQIRAYSGNQSRKMNKEAIRVISIMPDWIPGTVDGENVSVLCKQPIMFKLDS